MGCAADAQAQVAPPSPLQPRQWFAAQGRVVQLGIGGIAAFAGTTLLIAVFRTVRADLDDEFDVLLSLTPQARRFSATVFVLDISDILTFWTYFAGIHHCK